MGRGAGGAAHGVEDGELVAEADAVVVENLEGVAAHQVRARAAAVAVADAAVVELDAVDVDSLVVGLGPVHGADHVIGVEGDVEDVVIGPDDLHVDSLLGEWMVER